MRRVVSVRELVLLGVLIVLAAYYFVVQGPVAAQTAELQMRRAELESSISAANERITDMNKMRAELDDIYMSQDMSSALSDYSNNSLLLQELNLILNIADKFDVSFGDVHFSDNIMRREIMINFETRTHEAARIIVSMMETSGNTYLVTGFETSSNLGQETWISSVSLVNYEFVTDEQAAELGLIDQSKLSGDTAAAG